MAVFACEQALLFWDLREVQSTSFEQSAEREYWGTGYDGFFSLN